MKKKLPFSIIIPVFHGGRYLKKALESLGGLDFDKHSFEILVSGDRNDTLNRMVVEEVARKNNLHITYIQTDRINRSSRLNEACSQARGDIFVFGDDDCIFPKNWLNQYHSFFSLNPQAGIVGGVDEMPQTDFAFNKALDYVLTSFLGTGGQRKGSGFRTGKYYPRLWNMAIHKEVFFATPFDSMNGKLNVFREDLEVHEDVDLAARIEKSGKKIFFSPDIKVTHERNTNSAAFIIRNYQMAATAGTLGIHTFPHLILSLFSIWISFCCLFALFSDIGFLPWMWPAAGYGAVLFAGFLDCLIKTRQMMPSILTLLLLFVLHYAKGLGFLSGIAKRYKLLSSTAPSNRI